MGAVLGTKLFSFATPRRDIDHPQQKLLRRNTLRICKIRAAFKVALPKL
jgi:hypothetical protein